MKKVLIANIFGIGDVLFTTPLIANLKEAIPGAKIDYLCNARTQGILRCNSHIGQIFIYEKDDFVRVWQRSKISCLKAAYKLFSKIRQEKYDAVFDFILSRRFGLFFKLADIPRRVGLNYKNRGIFLTDKIAFNGFETRHVIEYYLKLLEIINIPIRGREMQLEPDKDSLRWTQDYLKEKGVDGKILVAIIPGGGTSWGREAGRKRWNQKGFSFVADALAKNGFKIALLGDILEADLCKEIGSSLSQTPAIIENNLSLKNYIALLSKCALVVCNDGGPLHIARALSVKTISIFGPVDEKVYGPYPPSPCHVVFTARNIDCRPCYNRFKLPECKQENRCLTEIDPHRVIEACLKLLKTEGY